MWPLLCKCKNNFFPQLIRINWGQWKSSWEMGSWFCSTTPRMLHFQNTWLSTIRTSRNKDPKMLITPHVNVVLVLKSAQETCPQWLTLFLHSLVNCNSCSSIRVCSQFKCLRLWVVDGVQVPALPSCLRHCQALEQGPQPIMVVQCVLITTSSLNWSWVWASAYVLMGSLWVLLEKTLVNQWKLSLSVKCFFFYIYIFIELCNGVINLGSPSQIQCSQNRILVSVVTEE